MKKQIIIDSCDNCPFNGGCEAWISLTSKQRVQLSLSPAYANGFILAKCHLEDATEENEANHD